MSEPQRLWTLPNMLTVSRIVLIPVLLAVAYSPFVWRYWAAAVIFAAASITDWFDGYLARKWQQDSPFGRFLDPVADKLMVAAALVILVETHGSAWLAIPAIVIISREITVSALREWMAEIGKRANVAVSHIGKVKTAFQMIAIIVLLAHRPLHDEHGKLVFDVVDMLSYGLLYVAVVLTLWSMMVYLRAAWPELRGANNR